MNLRNLKYTLSSVLVAGLFVVASWTLAGCGGGDCGGKYPQVCGSDVCKKAHDCCEKTTVASALTACQSINDTIKNLGAAGIQATKDTYCTTLQGTLTTSNACP
jgi:hypothetical protein